MNSKTSALVTGVIVTFCAAPANLVQAEDYAPIKAAVAAKHRSDQDRSRDIYRHPVETLHFFGLRPDMNVLEIWPGGNGWYTDILAPLLRNKGQLTVAVFGPSDHPFKEFFARANSDLENKHAANPGLYDRVRVTRLWAPTDVAIAPESSVDLVLTFRNLHNWMMWDQTADTLAAIHRSLKPGGRMGVTDHRARPEHIIDSKAMSGYVNEGQAIKVIEAAGFRLLARSEVNSNPKDTADYPMGVWTLPPTFRLGDEDRDKYEAIGESDRFTLLFEKVDQ